MAGGFRVGRDITQEVLYAGTLFLSIENWKNECPHAWRIGLQACGRVADRCFAWTASKVYGFLMGSFAAVGSMVLALGLVVAAIMALGRQKSAATFATSSGGLLISGAKR